MTASELTSWRVYFAEMASEPAEPTTVIEPHPDDDNLTDFQRKFMEAFSG